MKYNESHLDRNLRSWFENDNTHQLLRSINLSEGSFRGLTKCRLDIDFPILAIAGRNGVGKSTILALASCAFHGKKDFFKLPNRRMPYYTFADFFIQHSEDVPPEGISIWYGIAHDNWRVTDTLPNKMGVRYQIRKKKRGGKWNDYGDRVKRNVVFLGIDRIVPHNEKSQSKSYSRSFSYAGGHGWEDKVKSAVGFILGKEYDDFKFVSYSKYRLPIVTVNGKTYSGFNMGAGENALFETFSVMYSVAEGALIVIDEVELGLHAEAQKKFMLSLKQVCKERRVQIIFTTHSKEIYSSLPDDARVFIDSVNGVSSILSGISPEFAFSKLSAESSNELSLLVEDDVAKTIIQAVIPKSLRTRLSVEVIGSASALSRQLSANYNRNKKENIIVLYDADQKAKEKHNLTHAYEMTESSHDKEDVKKWLKSRMLYLPGNTWPERWLIDRLMEKIDVSSHLFNVDIDEFYDVLKAARGSEKHKEIYVIASLIGLDEAYVLNAISGFICTGFKSEFDEIIASLNEAL
ncbi:AAA family ATPase [Aeromonas hydrophila]|uniref:AAA family ATPase n=2 Tax=Aeromonas hydrophila TaxID=644 RepID=UPI001C5B5BE3|nr:MULTISPECIES: AAA family ATPase [Aeromonas]MBW3846863.1 AAA family ATPase [Aeromonas hydrophila]WAF93604.1 ATP-binding protein [Aeromonas sp. BC14]